MQSPSANNNEIDDIDQNDIQMFLEILKRPPSFSKVNEECVDEEVSCRVCQTFRLSFLAGDSTSIIVVGQKKSHRNRCICINTYRLG